MKKTPQDTNILHKCTKNHDRRLYCSWDMARDGCNCYLSFWVIFCPFAPVTVQKMKISKKNWKNLEVSSFYTSVRRIMIICYTNPEIWCVTDVIVIFILGYFLPFYPPNSPKNENIKEMKNMTGDIIILHTCTLNYDHRLYCSWDMAHDRCNCYFSFSTIFCPFTPLTARKTKISKKWRKKKPTEEIIILHKCTKTHDHML